MDKVYFKVTAIDPSMDNAAGHLEQLVNTEQFLVKFITMGILAGVVETPNGQN